MPATASTALQWTTLVVFGLMALVAILTGWRRPSLRAPAWALLLVAVNHVAWYGVFLLYPDWLGSLPTMVWSIVLRLQVAFTGILWLWLAATRVPR